MECDLVKRNRHRRGEGTNAAAGPVATVTRVPDTAITARGLGKRYRLGQQKEAYRTLRDALMRSTPPAGPGDDEARILWALRDVSFSVDRGEAVGIIGANGAGKTTLLKILSRITEPSVGEARVRGRVGSLLEVGTGFHLELTGRENVYMNGAILGMRKAEIDARFDEIVEFAEVERFIDTPVKRYSTGMYVRLAFAVAAHLDVDILLVDEVLSVGDLAFQQKCLGKMHDQTSAEGRTVLFVSHNLASVKMLTERCVWLERGGVRDIGPTDQIFRDYVIAHSAGVEAGRVEFSDLVTGRPGAKLSTIPQDVAFEHLTIRAPDGRITELHLEGDPIRVEIGLRCRVPRFTKPLEVLCRLRTIEGTVVFTSTTGLREVSLEQGLYATSFLIEPNVLTAGTYELALYTLSGVGQDVIPSAMRFRIEPNPKEGEIQPDAPGIVRVQYPWAELELAVVDHAVVGPS
jgi:lipopolysaccharide transport system ATP-binding protein